MDVEGNMVAAFASFAILQELTLPSISRLLGISRASFGLRMAPLPLLSLDDGILPNQQYVPGLWPTTVPGLLRFT